LVTSTIDIHNLPPSEISGSQTFRVLQYISYNANIFDLVC